MFWSRYSLLMLFFSSVTVLANSLIDTENYQSLVSDKRSILVGQSIVVLVIEATNAQTTARTDVSNTKSFKVSSFDNINRNGLGIGASGQDDGTGKTVRNGMATTQLSATITEILPNGMIRISGEHNLLVNDEHQKVVISGMAKIDDISKENTLISSRIVNASVEIQGVGVINNAQRRGAIARLMSWLGLL